MQGCVIMSRLSWPLAIIEGEAENEKMGMKWKQNEVKLVDEENRMKYYISWVKR